MSDDALIKYNLIVGKLGQPGCLEEILDDEKLRELIVNGETIRIYWGTAPTGIPSIGYFCPLKKIADFLRAGCEVTILFADLHAFLDSMKSPLDLIKQRTQVYKEIILGILEVLKVDHTKIKFVLGSEFQLTSEYQFDLLKLGNITTVHNATKAGTEVIKQNKNPMITSLLYPLFQCLDEVYLNCNVTLGGIDQRKIYTLARDLLPKIGYEKRVHLMNPIISSLSVIETGGEKVKMSASSTTGKISLIATDKEIRKTISKIYCQEGNISDNTGLLLLKELLFPILDDLEQKFMIDRPEKYGGQIIYLDYKSVETDFLNMKLSAPDLKIGISDILIQLITPIRARFQSPEMQALLNQAYN